MDSENPYNAPESDISTQDANEYYHPEFFQMRGRIGRLRYLAYTFVGYFIPAISLN